MDSAYTAAREMPYGANMSISAALVVELVDRIKELEKSCGRIRDDLLMRADIDDDGTRAVNVSSSVWNNFCDVLDNIKANGVNHD